MNEKILVVDDEADILKLLSTILAGENYEVSTAVDGQQGMDRFKEFDPDLVITDMKMPRKNGLELLREIKESGSHVDVMILTGHSDEATAIECLRNGAYDYLFKPLEDIDVLLTAIERALQKRTLETKNRHLMTQLEEMVIRDPLTGLYNHRQLQICLDEEIIRSKRYGHTFCILMLDIDHFKAVNDTYGHLFGDHVLKKMGEILVRKVRSADRTFRYGGEEFILVMPETSRKEAVSVAERLMEAVKSHLFECDGHQAKITISMGGAFYPAQSEDKTALINFADKALYQAKENGRDRFVLSFEKSAGVSRI